MKELDWYYFTETIQRSLIITKDLLPERIACLKRGGLEVNAKSLEETLDRIDFILDNNILHDVLSDYTGTIFEQKKIPVEAGTDRDKL